jgi:hypothetical protein
MIAWRSAPHNHADQVDFERKSLRLYHPSRLIRRPVILEISDYVHVSILLKTAHSLPFSHEIHDSRPNREGIWAEKRVQAS